MSLFGDALSFDQLMYWVAFSRVLGIGPVRFQRLLNFFQDAVVRAWQASSTELSAAGLDQRTINAFLQQRSHILPEQEIEKLERLRIQVITWRDSTYPPLLKKIEYAPPVLYMCGTLTEDDRRFTLGIVGTRKMTSDGRQVTERFARELTAGKITIVSGLALGVDTVAHTTPLDSGGRTLAVIASGLNIIYPSANYQLARRIVESGQGALITAFPLGVNPEAGNFPARNHLISGLSLGVLITEAPNKSGALITAGAALNQSSVFLSNWS
jgi:DNA processing protein